MLYKYLFSTSYLFNSYYSVLKSPNCTFDQVSVFPCCSVRWVFSFPCLLGFSWLFNLQFFGVWVSCFCVSRNLFFSFSAVAWHCDCFYFSKFLTNYANLILCKQITIYLEMLFLGTNRFLNFQGFVLGGNGWCSGKPRNEVLIRIQTMYEIYDVDSDLNFNRIFLSPFSVLILDEIGN